MSSSWKQQPIWLLILLITLESLTLSSDASAANTNSKLKSTAPKLLPMPLEDSYSEGSDTEMFCVVSNGKNSQDLNFYWFKDGSRLDNYYGRQYTIKFEQGFSRLIITNITVENTGNYTCRVENSHGHDSVSASLMVAVELKWLVEPQDIKIAVGQTAKMNCSARGQPQPMVRWIKLNSNINDTVNLKDVDGMLTINDATPHNSGLYECVASNKVEPDLKKIIKVDIQGK